MKRSRLSLVLGVATGMIGSVIAFGSTPAAASDSVDCSGLSTFSHRGAGGLAPENTTAAMALAERNGGDVFEIDLQLSSDGRVVAMHDRTLKRTTDVEQVFPGRENDPVGTFSYEELQRLDAGSWWGDGRFDGQRIPTLDKIVGFAGRNGARIGIMLELKAPATDNGLVEAVHAEMAADRRWGKLLAAGKVIFNSFEADELKLAKQLMPQAQLLWVSSLPADDATLAEAATWADFYGTHYRTLGAGDIDRIERHGLKSVLYTIDSPEPMVAAIDAGVDAIFTDVPNVLTAICAGRDPFPRATGIEVTAVVADVPGSDTQPETGEHFTLTNTTSAPVDVSGYYIRDAVSNVLKVGPGYTLPAGGSMRVYTGPGTNSADKYYNDYGANVLNNDGDSLMLFTPRHCLVDSYAY